MATDTDREIRSGPLGTTSNGSGMSRPAVSRPRRVTLLGPLLLVLSVGLLGFNLWWYWRESRPLPDLKTLSDWVGKGEYDRAEPALQEHLRRSPNSGEVRTVLARVLAARNDLLGCARQLHEVPPWWPTMADALYRAGQAYLMVDRAKDAEAVWQAVIERDPLHPRPPEIFHDTCLELLKLYSTEDRWEDAAVVIWRAYEEANPVDHPILLSMRLRSELERVAPAEAIVPLERYVAADPTDWEAIRALARVELALGRREDAERHFQACLKGQPENPRAWRDYLNMLNEAGDQEALESVLKRVPLGAEGEPDIWKLRGSLKEKARDWAGAAADYRKALELNPYARGCHYRLAAVEQRLGNAEEAGRYRTQADGLRDAQVKLRPAYAAFLDALARRNPEGPDLPTSLRQLAAICETLGWARLAVACNELANAS
ncbi:MAG: tetratricopeptide repeat protein [Isosphaeraceae bacterium]